MTILAFVFIGVGAVIALMGLIRMRTEIHHLHQTMDMRDRRYLAQFTGEAQEAERKFVNILRRARGVPPL